MSVALQQVVLRKFTCLSLFALWNLAPAHSHAETALISIGDATQLSEVQLAQVVADESTAWLSIHLRGSIRLALVTANSAAEPAPAADAWLRALDYATRVRVSPPPGPLAPCGAMSRFEVADTGLPEARRVVASRVTLEDSELALRRCLADAGLPVDVERIAAFASEAQPPFRVALYEVPAFGGNTEALRFTQRGEPGKLPRIAILGSNSVPVSWIALATNTVQPLAQESADPSEFPIAYRALDASTDYTAARRGWLSRNPMRWLSEGNAGAALFTSAVLPTGVVIDSVIDRYFTEQSGTSGSACEAAVRAAHARNSTDTEEFACNGADDLSRTLSEVGFAPLQLSRFYGALARDGATFHATDSPKGSSLLPATDFDDSGCLQAVSPPDTSNGSSEPPGPTPQPPVSTSPVIIGTPDEASHHPAPVDATGRHDESCVLSPYDSTSQDSCSGDSRSSDSRHDSCSGDSSSSDSSTDSCSGDSRPADSGTDSCSGDSSSSDSGSDSCSGSSDSSTDSSGCGKSEYDGDTCSGDSAGQGAARAKSAALRSSVKSQRQPPRRVRLSLLTLLGAALALPLRRLRASR